MNFPALRPPMIFGALRLMFKQASLSRMIFRAALLGMFLSAYSGQRFLSKLPFPREAGLASADVLRRLASTDVPQCNASDLRVFFFPAKRALRPGMILASLASRHDLRRHCDLGRSCPALRPLMLLSAMRPTERGITSPFFYV